MKKLAMFSAALVSAVTLTACGGSSDSSGSTTTTTPKTETPASTTPTTNTPANPTPVNPKPTVSACEVSGTFIYGVPGQSCTFSLPKFNGGATQTLVCDASGSGSIGGTITFGNSFNLNGSTVTCKK